MSETSPSSLLEQLAMRPLIPGPPNGRGSSRRRGTAAVEFAVAVPILILLAIGCCDLGRALADYIAVSNAARVGAEYGATHAYTNYTSSSWQGLVSQRAQQEMQGSVGLDPTQFAVAVSTVPESANLYLVTVTVTYPFSLMTAWPGLPAQFNVSHSVTMQRYR
jgi:Flp pilus assembly protein TadG